MSEETKKKYNPTLGGAFENAKFGAGAIKLDITAEALDTIMKNLQVGSSIVFKPNKPTTRGVNVGSMHYFTEILPPYNKEGFKNYKGSKESSSLD